MTRLQISVLLALVAAAWGASLWFAGVPVGMQHLAPFGATVGVVSFALTMFNLYLWRLPLVRTLLADRPVLAGGWRLQLTSSFIDDATGQTTAVDAFYVVRQTFMNVSIRAYTKKTTSKTLAAKLIKDEDGEWTLIATYGDWRSPLKNGGETHRGTVMLVLAGNPVTSFQGHYWTERRSGGEVVSTGRLDGADFASYEQAVATFEQGALAK
jgi:hypothetical protein